MNVRIIIQSQSSSFINTHILKIIYTPLRINEITNTIRLHRIQVTLKFSFSWWACKRRKPCNRKSSKYCLNTLPSRLLHPACLFFLQLFNSLHTKTYTLDTRTHKCYIFSKHLSVSFASFKLRWYSISVDVSVTKLHDNTKHCGQVFKTPDSYLENPG